MSERLTPQEAFDLLKAAKDTIQFACLNPHWWIGKSNGKYWYSYEDSDDYPESGDFAEFETWEEFYEYANHLLEADMSVPWNGWVEVTKN